MALLEDGRVMGHMLRVAQWMRAYSGTTGASGESVQAALGSSHEILESIPKCIASVMEKPEEETREFFGNFYRAQEKELGLREQDGRAFRVYLLLLIYWPQVESFRGRSMRQFYDAFAPMLGPVETGQEEDEEDAKERHFKWFEKLCERNLGLSFRSRGRPGKKSR